ncbi:MAG: gephyrin-like molybdotransferase Glp [Bradymonadaceae bacterium]
MISVSDALSTMADAIVPVQSREVPVRRGLGCAAAEPVCAASSLPSFAQSAMDGYALRADDVADARPTAPVALDVVGEAQVGAGATAPALGAGEAVKISTGAAIPQGADAVVRRERVECDGSEVRISHAVARGRDVRPVGEELDRGEPLVEPGTRLDEGRLAILSMTGVGRLEARPAPSVTILVSGDEVVGPDAERQPGEVYDANGPLLVNWVRSRTGATAEVTTLPDDVDETRRTMASALSTSDLVVSTGGVSVGDDDHLGDAAEELGARDSFWRVAQKPGKPVYFGVVDDTPYLGLPGNPGAAFVGAHVYLQRAVDCLQGLDDPGPTPVPCRLTGTVERSSSRTRWVGARVRSRGTEVRVRPVDGHRLGQLYDVDGLVSVPPGDGSVASGDELDWIDRRIRSI